MGLNGGKDFMLNEKAIAEDAQGPTCLSLDGSKVKSSTLWVRTDISGNANKLFSAVGLKAPPKLLNLAKNQNPGGTNS